MTTRTMLTVTTVLAICGCEGPSYDSAGGRDDAGAARADSGPAAADGGARDSGPGVDAGAMPGVDDPSYDEIAAAEAEELGPEWRAALAERVVDYSAALRIASLRLTGEPPSLLDIRFVASAGDQRAAYETVIDRYLDDPRFARQMRAFFRDTFKMGGTAELDTAPILATELTVEDRDFTQLFTATAGNCPTWSATTGAFASADCDSGAPSEAGVLTNPAVMKQFSSNLGFRRVRWIQETFDCARFPTETTAPIDVGGPAPYTSPWPFESIAGTTSGGRIDFLDVSSVVCANCHSTMNHIAPLVGNFDEDGMWQDSIVVTLPSEGNPPVELGDWLPPGERTSWRLGVPAADLPALGRAMAADREVATCSVARVWNFALGKGDIVTTLTVVPDAVLRTLVDDYVSSGHRLKRTIRAIFTSDDFVRF